MVFVFTEKTIKVRTRNLGRQPVKCKPEIRRHPPAKKELEENCEGLLSHKIISLTHKQETYPKQEPLIFSGTWKVISPSRSKTVYS